MPFRQQVPPHGEATVPPIERSDTFPRIIYHDLRSSIQTVINFFKKWWLPIIFLVLIYLILRSSIFMTESSYVYIYENLWTGKVTVYMQTSGIHIKTPFSPVTRYNQVWTVNFGTRFTGEQILEKGPIQLRFADSYTANIPGIFRYKLPRNEDKLKTIHREFTNFYNLIDSLLIPISKSVMVSTATQYTGEEFFLGGLNTFRTQLLNQLQYGIYETERRQVEVEQRDFAGLFQDESMQRRTTSMKIWKTMPVKGPDGDFQRIDNPLETYGIEVTQVDLGVPVADSELGQLLAAKKSFDRQANDKADELALILEDQKIQLANIKKDEKTQLAHIEKEQRTQLAREAKDKKIQLAKEDKDKKIQTAQKVTELALVKEDEKINLAKKAEALALEKEDQKIQLAKKQKVLAIELATTKAKKEEDLIVAQENLKIHLANVETETKANLAKKAEALALEKEDEKIKLAQQAKEQKILLAKKAEALALEKEDEKIKLAKKAEALALEKEDEKIQRAKKATELAIEKENEKIQRAKKATELAIVEEETKIQAAKKAKELAIVDKEQSTQLAKKAEALALEKEDEKIQLAKKATELAITEAEKKIQMAKKAEELAVAQAEQKIQKANFEAAQFEAKAIQEKGVAEANVLKAKYEARLPELELYKAEIQREIAQLIYPNLNGINVTMPHNVVNLGDNNTPLQTNLDVLSSFATIGVMEGLEKKALSADTTTTTSESAK
jgi:hypothetical protein